MYRDDITAACYYQKPIGRGRFLRVSLPLAAEQYDYCWDCAQYVQTKHMLGAAAV